MTAPSAIMSFVMILSDTRVSMKADRVIRSPITASLIHAVSVMFRCGDVIEPGVMRVPSTNDVTRTSAIWMSPDPSVVRVWNDGRAFPTPVGAVISNDTSSHVFDTEFRGIVV